MARDSARYLLTVRVRMPYSRKPGPAGARRESVRLTGSPIVPRRFSAGNRAAERWLAGQRSSPPVAERDFGEVAAERFADSTTRGGFEKEARPREPRYPAVSPRRVAGLDLLGNGQRLPDAAREFFEPHLGRDLSGVRVHQDSAAADSARAMHARAYTIGTHIVFGRGEFSYGSAVGNRVLAHELAHVVQQSDSGTVAVQRKVRPEDVSSEMVGREFELTEDFKVGSRNLPAGRRVKVESWSNASEIVGVSGVPGGLVSFAVPKSLLRPVGVAVPGIVPYGAALESQRRTVAAGARDIETEKSRKGGPRPGEIPRLEGLQKNRQVSLNERLIQETMFNRFDPAIRQWTDHCNQQFGYKGSAALDPNLVKAMLYQESRLGTSGEHLEVAPRVHMRSRFNLGQAIDSGASAQLLMMREMQPDLIKKHHLESIESDRDKAPDELKALQAVKKRTPTQQARLDELVDVKAKSKLLGLSFGETFMWLYRAPGQSTGFDEAVIEFFASVSSGQPARYLDYEFWIRTAIRWLFEKRRSVKSWEEAIRAYNGSGARAERYREQVTGRAARARASKSGTFDAVRDEREQKELRRKTKP